MPAPLELEDAQARLLALAAPLSVEHVDLANALGRYLAEPLVARRTQPAADISAMDGYAICSAVGPWRVVGESAAGHPYVGSLGSTEAVRIATGALIPHPADRVVIQENVRRDADTVWLSDGSPTAGDHIRLRGNDFAEGDALLPAGARFGPAQLALAIAAGHNYVAVRRMPCVVVIDTGDELAADPDDCARHQVPASNGATLVALLAEARCEVRAIGPVRDTRDALLAALTAAADADVIVTSGGASVGDHDLLQPALSALGADIAFWNVAIKPGKPLLVARNAGQLIVGLPGNPVSSYVTALLFVLPLVRALAGAAQPLPRRMVAGLDGECPAGGSRREFLRGVWDGYTVRLQPPTDSGVLHTLALSNALIDRAAQAPAAYNGDTVVIYPFGNGGPA